MIIVVGKNKEGSVFNVCKIDNSIQIKQLGYTDLYKIASNGGCENYKVVDNKLQYTQGSENNMPSLSDGGLFVVEKLIKGNEKAFRVLDTNSMKIQVVNEKESIRLEKVYDIINAKVTTINDKEVLASLGGNFKETDVTKRVQTCKDGLYEAKIEQTSNENVAVKGSKTQDRPKKFTGMSFEEIKENYLNMDTAEVVKEYEPSAKMSYIESRAKKGPFATKIAKVLAIGLIVASTAGVMGGCSDVEVDYNTKSNTTTESGVTVKETEKIDALGLIKEAKKITLRSHKLSLSKGMDIIIEGTKVGEVKGDVIHFGDTLVLTDNDGNTLAKSGEDLNVLFKSDWCIVDESDNVLCALSPNHMTLRDVSYDIVNKESDTLGTLQSSLISNTTGEIVGKDDKEIASISGNIFNKNVDIEIKDSKLIDNRALILMLTTYAYEADGDD